MAPPTGDRGEGASPRVMVRLHGVRKAFGRVVAVEELSLEIREGEFLSLLGPSGCGKTTTLNLIAGFFPPTAGTIEIAGEDVTDKPAYLRGLGMVFQSYALFPHMTVFDNVAYGLRMRRVPKPAIRERVREALALVHLERKEGARHRQLSGGEQQRVALARALVYHPPVLLLDEPLAALDRKLRDTMRAELKEIQRRVGITTIFVTHDQQEALSLSDRIVVMSRGRAEQVGTPREIYDRPRTRFVADFVGAVNVLPGRVTRTAGDLGVLLDGLGEVALPGSALGAGVQPGDRVDLFVRPESVRLSSSPAGSAVARVREITYLGQHTEVRLAAGPDASGPAFTLLIEEKGQGSPPPPGTEVRVEIDPRQARIFPREREAPP
jgi:putative spermidine/putrescine transport system ATP-binding protein